jgi:hypothetical protein
VKTRKGHGGYIDEDGKKEFIFPGDYLDAGRITDEEIFNEFITLVPDGVHCVVVIDCCHAGGSTCLPYVLLDKEQELCPNELFTPVPIDGGGKKKEKGKKQVKKSKDKKPSEKVKKSKSGGKKKKPKEEEEASDAEEEEDDQEEAEEVEREEPKKKKGLFGFGKKKKK